MTAQRMKVRATQLGYFGHRLRHPGQEFLLTDKDQFAAEWMAPVGWMPEGYTAPDSFDEEDELDREAAELSSELEAAADVKKKKTHGGKSKHGHHHVALSQLPADQVLPNSEDKSVI